MGLILFILNGFDVFSCSARGEYSDIDDLSKKANSEIISFKMGNFKTDRQNLRKDRREISLDMRNAFNKLSKQWENKQ